MLNLGKEVFGWPDNPGPKYSDTEKKVLEVILILAMVALIGMWWYTG